MISTNFFTSIQKILKNQISFHVITNLTARDTIRNCVPVFTIKSIYSNSFNFILTIRAWFLPKGHKLFICQIKNKMFKISTTFIGGVKSLRGFLVVIYPSNSIRVFGSIFFSLYQFLGGVFSFSSPHFFYTLRRKFVAFFKPSLIAPSFFKSQVCGFHMKYIIHLN